MCFGGGEALRNTRAGVTGAKNLFCLNLQADTADIGMKEAALQAPKASAIQAEHRVPSGSL